MYGTREGQLTRAQVVTLPLSKPLIRLAEDYASRSAIGGRSAVRSKEDRSAELMSDQVVGHLGQIALHLYWFGGLERYRLGRFYADTYPTQGDGGADIGGANVDVKTSRMRYGQDPLAYHLPVRNAERHDGWVYVLGLVGDAEVHLVGWYPDQLLETWRHTDGTFAGACAVPAVSLYALPPVKYQWN